MNWADWAILAVIVISCLISLKRGFVKEALSLAIWILAFVIAMTFRGPLASLLVEVIATPSLREMAAFGILFTLTLIVGAMVNYLLGELVRMTGLAGTDRMFGMVFGVVRGFVIVMAVLILMPAVVPVDQDGWWRQSAFIPSLLAFEGLCRNIVSELTTFVMGLVG